MANHMWHKNLILSLQSPSPQKHSEWNSLKHMKHGSYKGTHRGEALATSMKKPVLDIKKFRDWFKSFTGLGKVHKMF